MSALSTTDRPETLSTFTAETALEQLAPEDRSAAMRSVEGMRQMLAGAAVLKRIRHGAMEALRSARDAVSIGELKRAAREAQTIYLADVAQQMAALVDPQHGRPRGRAPRMSPAQKHAARLPSPANVPAWAQHLYTQGTVLESPSAVPFEASGPHRTPLKVVVTHVREIKQDGKVVKAGRRPLYCIFCGSDAKERGPELNYDICSECFKAAKADVERAYVQGHPEASASELRHVQMLAVVQLLATSRPDLKATELRPLARHMVEQLNSDTLDVVYPDLAERIRATANQAASEYILPHPEATEADLAKLQPFPADVTKRAAAHAIRETVAYSYANDPRWAQAVRVMTARRRQAERAPGNGRPDRLGAPVELLDVNYSATYTPNEIVGRAGSYDDESYDGQFEDPSLSSDVDGSLHENWVAYVTHDPERAQPIAVDEAIRNDPAYRARKARTRRRRAAAEDKQISAKHLAHNALASAGARRSGNRFRTPTFGMAADRTSFLSELEPGALYLSNDALDTSDHLDAIAENAVREVAEDTWQKIRAGKLSIGATRAAPDMPALPLFPRLRTPASAPIGTDASASAWDQAIDQFLQTGQIGEALDAVGITAAHAAWAEEHRRCRLPQLQGDSLYSRMPMPEITARITRAAIERENDPGVDPTEYAYATSNTAFVRIFDGEEIMMQDDVLVWGDHDFEGRSTWTLSNRAHWVRRQVEQGRALHGGKAAPKRRRRVDAAKLKQHRYRNAQRHAEANGFRLQIAA